MLFVTLNSPSPAAYDRANDEEKEIYSKLGDRGSTVVKVLCYKIEGRWFDSIWCYWNFSLT